MSQIAQYRERRFGTRRDFVLFDDAVSIRGKTFLLSEFDSTVPLQALVPTTSRAKIRNPTFLGGLALFLFAVTLISMFWGGPGPKQNLPIFVLGCLLTLLGLLLGFAIFRKIEFVQFQNEAGLMVLDIARVGPDASRLDDFVSAIVGRIHQLRMSPNSTVDPDARKSRARGSP